MKPLLVYTGVLLHNAKYQYKSKNASDKKMLGFNQYTTSLIQVILSVDHRN